MSRRARIISSLGYYHIRLKTNKLLKEKDKQLFLNTVQSYASNCQLLSYALLDNVLFLVVKTNDISISTLMRKITVRFIRLYKQEYPEVTDVFSGRFISEAANSIEDVYYFIGKTHAVGREFYTDFCSDHDYFNNKYIDLNFYYSYLTDEEQFNKKCAISENVITVGDKMTDEQLSEYISNTYELNIEEVKNLPSADLLALLTSTVKKTNASARQINRVTKVPLRYVTNAKTRTKHKMEQTKVNIIPNRRRLD
ncbi:MAG: hypothetical protein HUJ61_02305 [Bacilli bacterium]|nr:hypothetical protein [Bacilli bacterium]